MKIKIMFLFLFLTFFNYNKAVYFEEDELKKICKKCESGFNDTYKQTDRLNKVSDNDKINQYVILFVEMIKNDFNSSKLIDEYVRPRIIVPNILYIILAIILLLIWIALIVVICKNKVHSQFSPNNESEHLKYHLLAYITIIISLIIIILSSISMVYIQKSQIYFNSSICSLLRIYIDLRDGDQARTTQWRGIIKLQTDLVGDEDTVNKLIEYINLHEEVTDELNNNKYIKETIADTEKNNNYYSNKQVTSPSSILLKVFPEYSRKRKDHIIDIYKEYSLKLHSGVIINQEIKELNEQIKENPELITNENLFINSKLNEILEAVQFSAEKYFQYLIDYTKDVNNILFPILYAIFSLTIFLSLAGIIFIFLYIRDNKINEKLKRIFRIILHIIWNILLFLFLLTLTSQICFKIFKIFGEDGSGLLQYATSEQNFNSSDSILFKGAGKVFLETCFRDDKGDLLQKIMENMQHKSSKMQDLTNIIKKEITYQI